MKNKKLFKAIKAQVTAFVIIGILIVAIIWGAWFISGLFAERKLKPAISEEQKLSLESDTIKGNIDNCVAMLADRGTRMISERGFYLDIPQGYQHSKYSAYWMADTINVMPSSLARIEGELETYIGTNLANCVSFDDFRQEGWELSELNPVTDVEMLKEDISVEVNYTITARKGGFARDISDSVYIPKIRFRQMYEKSIDFMNNQLLRPDFDINQPFKGYDQAGYVMTSEKINDKTLSFTIKDGLSKIVDKEPFTLKFVASFDTNSVPRTYDVTGMGIRTLVSPDRLAVLTLLPGVSFESDKITIRQYEKDSVTREQTPIGKKNSDVMGYRDVNFQTDFPIYRFEPDGEKFNTPAILTIFLNKDQRKMPEEYSFLYNGADSWIPFPHVIDEDTATVSTMVPGFSEFAAMSCEGQTEESFEAVAEEERSWWEVAMPIVILIIAALLIMYAPIFQATYGTWFTAIQAITMHTVSLSTLGWATLGTVVLGSAYMAYTGFTDTLNADKTITITAKCDDEISIGLSADGGDCKCTIIDTGKGSPRDLSSGKYKVKAGKTYTMTAVLEGFDWPETSATCKCTAAGLITTNGANPSRSGKDKEELEDELPEELEGLEDVTEPLELACCITDDGYCLENYLISLCSGVPMAKSCSEIPECTDIRTSPAGPGGGGSANGVLQFSSTSGREGDEITVTYYLVNAGSDTRVIAHIKSAGAEIAQLELFDDGQHSDGNSGDKYYANKWNSANVLSGSGSKDFIFDIEVVNGNARETISNAGTIIIIGQQDCIPIGRWDRSNSINIEFMGNNYADANKYPTDVNSAAARILLTEPFTGEGVNFYRIGRMFNSPAIAGEMITYSNAQCNYASGTKLKIILDDASFGCVQDPMIAMLNTLFTFKDEVASAAINNVMLNFCSYVDVLAVPLPLVFNLLSISPLAVPPAVSTILNLADYVTDPYNDKASLAWSYSPATSSCFSVSISGGQATLTHTGADGCSEIFTFTAADNARSRTVSDSVNVVAG